MALSTSTSTLAAGASRTFNLSTGSALTLVAPPNVRATVTETPNTVSASDVGGNASRTHNLQMVQTVTYGPYPMGGTVVVANASNSGATITWVRSDSIVAESAAGAVSLVDGAGNVLASDPRLTTSTGYHFAGLGIEHPKTATKFYDRSGMGNDATFQASLTAADAWANAGYCTIPDPTGLTALAEIPPISFDYLAGETLFFFWRGLATPEGADFPIIGDCGDPGSFYRPGWTVVCKASGVASLQLRVQAGTLYSGSNSQAAVFSATVENTLAVCLDGTTKTHCYWVNGVREAQFASGFTSFSSGTSIDTKYTNTIKVGGNGIVSSGNQWGVLQKIKQMHILRRAAGLGVPSGIDAMVLNLHRDVQRRVTAAEW